MQAGTDCFASFHPIPLNSSGSLHPWCLANMWSTPLYNTENKVTKWVFSFYIEPNIHTATIIEWTMKKIAWNNKFCGNCCCPFLIPLWSRMLFTRARMILIVKIFRGVNKLSQMILCTFWKSDCCREDAACPALQKKINHFGLEIFKDFLLNPTFHQRNQYKIPCLNNWWLFPYTSLAIKVSGFLATASLPWNISLIYS